MSIWLTAHRAIFSKTNWYYPDFGAWYISFAGSIKIVMQNASDNNHELAMAWDGHRDVWIVCECSWSPGFYAIVIFFALSPSPDSCTRLSLSVLLLFMWVIHNYPVASWSSVSLRKYRYHRLHTLHLELSLALYSTPRGYRVHCSPRSWFNTLHIHSTENVIHSFRHFRVGQKRIAPGRARSACGFWP